MRGALILGLTITVFGCGDKDSGGGSGGGSADATAYHGVYETKEKKATAVACEEGTLADATDEDFSHAFFKLAPFTLVDKTVPVTLFECTSADECTDTIGASYTFNTYVGEQWTISDDWTPMYSSSSGDDQQCSFGFSKVSLGKSGEQIVIREERHEGKVGHPAGDTECDLDLLYAANKATLACSKVITVKAQKVKDL